MPSLIAGHPTMLPPQVEAMLVKQLLVLAENGCSIEVCKLPMVVVRIAKSLKLSLGNFVGGSRWLISFWRVIRSFPSARRPRRTKHDAPTLTVLVWRNGTQLLGR